MPATVPAAVISAAQASQRKWGCPASVACAQWALESSWGKRVSGKNNPFGIKATAGQPATLVPTHEVVGGKSVAIVDRFRDFTSLADAFDGHGRLLATGKAYAEARQHLDDPKAFARALTGRYATDPDYHKKLWAIMDAGRFYAFDVNRSAPDVMVSSTDVSVSAESVNPQPTFWQRLGALFGLARSNPIG